METSEENKFVTRDITLAATLTTLGIYHERTDFTLEGEKNNAIGYFVFDNTPELIEAEIKFRKGELLVEPKFFMSNLHQLKAFVINYLRSPHTDLNK